MYFICQVLAGTHVWTESISKDISVDHQIVLEWKESMIAVISALCLSLSIICVCLHVLVVQHVIWRV